MTATRRELEMRVAAGSRNQGRRWDYRKGICVRCGYEVCAPPSRWKWVMGMHAERCEASTPEERAAFRRTGRWARRKR